MFLMMTNVALSLQWCVPHTRAGGLEGGVGIGELNGQEKMGGKM